ncbi:MAG: TetR/AcrR family transcriptional regulator [Parvibaculaceae bacterium]
MKKNPETDPGAPPTEKGATRREEILEAASQLLLEEGYARFSARGVAARAGVRLSHVQYYFQSPAAILAELLDRFVHRYGDEIVSRFATGKGTPEERLYRSLDYLLNDEVYRRDCGLFMIEVAGFAARDQLIAAALARYYEIYFSLFSDMAKALKPSLTARDRAKRARQCVALIEGMSMTRPHMGAMGEADFNAREATRAILRLLADA